MKYVVMIKQVPDTMDIMVDADGNLIRQGVPSILDPYCEYALDMATDVKKSGDRIIAVTMGPDQSKDALLRCLELGADEAFLLTDRGFAGADTYATSRTLVAFIKKFIPDYDLILCGKQASDGDTAQVPAEVARMLCSQQFYYTEKLQIDGDMSAIQNYLDEIRVTRIPSGSVISVSKGHVNHRLPSISDMLSANKKQITVLNRVDLGLGAFSVGMKGSKTHIISSYSPRSNNSHIVMNGTDTLNVAEFLLKEVHHE